MITRLLLLVALFHATAWSKEPIHIPADSIGFDYILTGISGIPIGKEFVIEGHAVSDPDRDNPKDGGDRKKVLLITSVNGKKLKKPTEAYIANCDVIPADIIFRLKVCEEVSFELFITPNRSPDPALPVEEGTQRLSTSLQIIEQTSPESPKLEKTQKEAEQAGADQPATAPQLKPENQQKPQPESEARPR